MKLYTKTGDKGQTSLAGGKRVMKDSKRVELYGTLDELNAALGFAASSLSDNCEDLKNSLQKIQSLLFEIGSVMADPGQKKLSAVQKSDTAFLEDKIDRYTESLETLTNFILPGGCESASRLHLARTVCRRLERRMVSCRKFTGKEDFIFINRLSDFLFCAARMTNHRNSIPDFVWKKST
ncbi:MAG: cob(I)yrinic acid a,c-diamide adenosyltransferase [Spirochaetia bacterium]|nr:cob(I)yrinic acid a,c-diamide adenosyltransferase [Spirochaetia bacterium]